MHEAMEVYNYWSCAQQETNPRIKAIWERFLDYEQGHLYRVAEIFKEATRRDTFEILPETLPEPLPYESQREFVRKVLIEEVDMRSRGTEYVGPNEESEATLAYRKHIHSEGVASDSVAAGYRYRPGTELSAKKPQIAA